MNRRTILVAGGVWLAAHLLLLLPLSAVLPAALQPHVVQALAALVVAGFVPGWLLVYALVGQGDAPPPWWEGAVLAAGAAYVVLVGGMLLLSYLPGGPTLLPALALFDLLALGLASWVYWRGHRRGMRSGGEHLAVESNVSSPDLMPAGQQGNTHRAAVTHEAGAGMRSAVGEPRRAGEAFPADLMPLQTNDAPRPNDTPRANDTPRWPAVDRRWLLAGALVLLLVGGVLRLGNLGYADFQGDEARAALRAAATIQGYEDVLFLHKKGPTEILLPTALYVLTGHLTEATARLPFALANLAALFAAWLLGRRLFNPLAGWIAAMFFALDGYFIGFARIVQYQSVVLLMSLLTVLVLYRLVRRPQALTGWLALAALLLATGLLSHYEGALAALPAAALWLVLIWQRRREWRRVLTATAVAAVVGGALLGAFYAPYVLNPRFAATYYYLTDRRIGGSPPYNNLLDVFLRTTLYSTTYYVLLLIGLTVVGMVRVFRRGLARSAAVASIAALLLLVGVTFANPTWMVMGGRDWIIVPFALIFAALLITPKQSLEERVLWLWFAAVMVLALFLTEKPRTHVYTFFIPWLLLCGQAAAWMYDWVASKWAGAGMRSAAGESRRDDEVVPADLMPLRETGNAPSAAGDAPSATAESRRGMRSGGEDLTIATNAPSPDLMPVPPPVSPAAGMRSAAGESRRDDEASSADLMPLRELGNAPSAAGDAPSATAESRRGMRSGGEDLTIATNAPSPDLMPVPPPVSLAAGMRSAAGESRRDDEASSADLMPLRELGNAPSAAGDAPSATAESRRGMRSGGEDLTIATNAPSPDLMPVPPPVSPAAGMRSAGGESRRDDEVVPADLMPLRELGNAPSAAAGAGDARRARAARWAGVAVAAALTLLFGVYAYAFFVSTDEVMLHYYTARPPGYWVTYTEPDDKARFGFPLNNGWKVIGELYRQGELSGPFDSSEKEAWVPAWYTRGVERCPRDADWFFEIRNLEPFSHEDELAMEHYLRQGFEKWGKVTVGGQDKLVIYQRTGNHLEFPTQTPNAGLRSFAFEDFAAVFDANAAPDLPLTYPSVDPAIAHLIGANFGDLITLEGYDISYPTPLRPGDTIRLTLYWRGQQPIAANYKVFNQLYAPGGKMQAQRDGFPVCDGRETWRWDPGELITDVYDIPVAADAEDGLYPLYTGFYREDTGERLPVLDAAGNEIDTQVHVTDVRIGVE